MRRDINVLPRQIELAEVLCGREIAEVFVARDNINHTTLCTMLRLDDGTVVTINQDRNIFWFKKREDIRLRHARLVPRQTNERTAENAFLDRAVNGENRHLYSWVGYLGLPVRIATILELEGVMVVGELTRMDERGLLALKGFGEKSLLDVKRVLAIFGLYLGMDFHHDKKMSLARERNRILSALRAGEMP